MSRTLVGCDHCGYVALRKADQTPECPTCGSPLAQMSLAQARALASRRGTASRLLRPRGERGRTGAAEGLR